MNEEQRYWSKFDEYGREEIRPLVEKIIEWVRPKIDYFYVSKGSPKYGLSIVPVLGKKDKLKAFSIWAKDRFEEIEVNFYRYEEKYAPMDKIENRQKLMAMLNEIDGVDIPSNKINLRPRFKIQLLENEANFKKFTEAFDWFYEQLES